ANWLFIQDLSLGTGGALVRRAKQTRHQTAQGGLKMLGRITGTVRFTEPLSFYTSLRIGGPAEFFVMPHDVNDVRYALAFADQEDLPVVVIGGGNNMLVSDAGLQAVVLKLEGVLGRAEFNGDEVAVGAGMPLSALIREAAALGLGGLAHPPGSPAPVGGAARGGGTNLRPSGGRGGGGRPAAARAPSRPADPREPAPAHEDVERHAA